MNLHRIGRLLLLSALAAIPTWFATRSSVDKDTASAYRVQSMTNTLPIQTGESNWEQSPARIPLLELRFEDKPAIPAVQGSATHPKRETANDQFGPIPAFDSNSDSAVDSFASKTFDPVVLQPTMLSLLRLAPAGLMHNVLWSEVPVDPLPSWKDSAAKQAILKFVHQVTQPDSPNFVPPADRIATFDNDGTLWTEHPMYTQLAFALDRVRSLAPQHPEWKTKQPFQAVLENDLKALSAAGEKGLIELVMASHAGMSTAEFQDIVLDWFATARHPRFKRPYTQCVFQPMLELLAYLRAHDFKTFIVSGGGVEFMRPMTPTVYGIPPEQVVGSTIKTQYQVLNGKPVLIRLPEIDFIDDKAGKPAGINKFIGKRPIAAFGNSAGDREMLEWTGAGEKSRLMMLVLHDDSQREYAYGPARGLPNTEFGTFPASLLDVAREKGWVVISMRDDWARIFAFDE